MLGVGYTNISGILHANLKLYLKKSKTVNYKS